MAEDQNGGGPLWGPGAADVPDGLGENEAGPGQERGDALEADAGPHAPPGEEGTQTWGLPGTAAIILIYAMILPAAMFAAVPLFNLWLARIGPEAASLPFDQAAKQHLGDSLWITMIPQAALCALLVLGAVLMKRGATFTDYLALNKPSAREWVLWAAILGSFLFLSEMLLNFFEVPAAPYVEAIVSTVRFMPGLVAGVVLAAPAMEEFIFRGLVYRGVENSLGPAWAVIVSALPWAAFHLMVYHRWFDILLIVSLGLVFGLARRYSGSIFVPLLLHVLNNGAAVLIMTMSK